MAATNVEAVRTFHDKWHFDIAANTSTALYFSLL